MTEPAYVREVEPGADPVSVNVGTTVRLESRLPSLSSGEESTNEVWSGARDPIMAMYGDYAIKTGVGSLTVGERGAGMLELRVTWNFSITSFSDADDEPVVDEDDKPQWNIERIRVTSPLASHPYWQLAYIAASGSRIEDHIAQVDFSIAHGDVYDPASAGDYEEWVKRYWALRIAGVDSYPEYGVSIRKTFRTDNAVDIRDVTATAKQVVNINNLRAPKAIRDALAMLPKITGYTDANGDPSSNPGDVRMNIQGAEWEFYQLPPTFSGPANGPWELDVEWIGMERWSAVLYPGGSWDPPTT